MSYRVDISKLSEETGIGYQTIWAQLKRGYCNYPRIVKDTRSKHPLHERWYTMWQRCTNPKSISYKNYGAKGIIICDRWKDFWLFVEDMGECPHGYTLDRIDYTGNYEPSNCRWASWEEQNLNRKMTVKKTTYGVHKHGLKYHFTFHHKLYKLDTLEEAIELKLKLYSERKVG